MKKEEISDFLTTKNNTNRDRDKLGRSFKLLCSDEGNSWKCRTKKCYMYSIRNKLVWHKQWDNHTRTGGKTKKKNQLFMSHNVMMRWWWNTNMAFFGVEYTQFGWSGWNTAHWIIKGVSLHSLQQALYFVLREHDFLLWIGMKLGRLIDRYDGCFDIRKVLLHEKSKWKGYLTFQSFFYNITYRVGEWK